MSAVLSFIAWSFLPSFITSWSLTILYRLFTRAGDPVPQRGTPRYARDYRRLNILVISAYLLYTIYESYAIVVGTPNFYDLLSVPHDVDERALRTRFRRLSVLYHPDKAGAEGADVFVLLKHAYDVLNDQTVRFAYDRFGAEVVDWRGCVVAGDYVRRGAGMLVPWYGGSVLVLLVLTVLGKFELGRYWRYYVLFLLMAVEAAVITTPYNFLDRTNAWGLPLKALLPFEQLVIARKVVLTSFIAFSQLGPLISPAAPAKGEELSTTLERLQYVSAFVENEAKKLLVHEILPFEADAAAMKGLERKMGEWIVEDSVRRDPEVREAMGRAIQRKRDAPAGARGTK